MPKVLHVEEFPELGCEIEVPALLYGLTDLTLGEDRATGQTALIGRFQSCILIDATRPRASLQAAILAAQLIVVLRYQMWGLEFVTGIPENIHAQPEAPTQELEQFVMWSVQWTQAFEIGTLEWPWPDEPPGSVMPELVGGVEIEFTPEEVSP